MSALRLLPVLLALSACTVDGTPASRQAAASLHWMLETTDGRFLGSATAIGQGCLLTNQHVVVAAAGQGLTARQGDEAVPVGWVRSAEGLDAALLALPRRAGEAPMLRAAAPEAGERLVVSGAVAAAPRQEAGEAMDAAQASRFGRHLRPARLPVAPGFSGGPVVDAQGRLVGIVVAAAAASMAEAQRLAATRHAGALEPRIALLLDPAAALAELERSPGEACNRRGEAR
jgi:S1-C subfamily serine protease